MLMELRVKATLPCAVHTFKIQIMWSEMAPIVGVLFLEISGASKAQAKHTEGRDLYF